MKLLSIIALFFGFVSHASVFDSGVPAAAQTPFTTVDGRANYQFFSGAPGHRISQCVLIHGYGISQQTIDMVNKVDNMKSKIPAAQEMAGILGNGFNGRLADFLGGPAATPLVATDALAQSLARLASLDGVQAFGYFYFGEYFIQNLLQNACDNVVVLLQESNQTSVLEMIVRTERFLKDVGCAGPVAPGQIGCALVGHSKGGAVVTSIVRRCAEAIPYRQGDPYFVGGSQLGETGCRQIGEVYSSSGNIEGEILPIILAGSRNLEARKKEMEKLTFGMVDMTKQFDEGIRKLQGLQAMADKFKVDFFSDKTELTNPFWYDESPIAEIDGFGEADRSRGVPIALRHGPGFVLSKKGWLGKIEYAASGGGYRFDKAKYTFAERDGVKLASLDMSTPPKLTVGRLPPIAPRPKFLPEGGARLRNQNPDRVARREKARHDLDFFWEPFIEGQKIADTKFMEIVGQAHGDPQASASFAFGVQEISAFAKKNELTDEKGEVGFLKRFRMKPLNDRDTDGIYFQISDGITEEGTAIGLCQRSQKAAADVRIVTSCASFPDTHHLGLTGMAMDVADHIVKQLSK